MKGLILLVLFAAFTAARTNKVVVCYYTNWAAHRKGPGQFTVNHLDPHLCTHLIYAFAGINAHGAAVSLDPKLDLAEDDGADNFRLFNDLKKKNTALKTLLSVGGWNEGSAKFSRMAADPTLRKNFIESAIVLLTKHGFNGLDISWLYPSQRDSPNHEADKENFSLLLKEMRVYFDERGLILTVAVSAAPRNGWYNVADIARYAHLVNLMAHDLHGPWDATTNYNAALHKGDGENYFTVDVAVDYWLKNGCPAEKLVLGIPIYGHTYGIAYRYWIGPNYPANGPGIKGHYTQIKGAIAYFEFCALLKNEPWTIVWDSSAQVHYAHHLDNWVSYDDSRSVTAKVEFALKHNLAGVMAWSVDMDDFNNVCGEGKFTLLNVINKVLKK